MRVHFDHGVRIGKDLVLDAVKKTAFPNGVITHAHSDHVHAKASSNLVCTPETLSLLKTNFEKPFPAHSVKFNKPFSVNDYTLTFHNAGHILGSAQVLIENGSSLAYTGDLKLQSSLTEQSAEPLQADTLILESTFGAPQYQFPDRETVYQEMARWCKQELAHNNFIILSGYALGKSQELTAFCNSYLGIAPLVHERIFENNRVYEKHKVKLGSYYKLNHNLKDSPILIMPSSLLNGNLMQAIGFSVKHRVVSARATGWPYRGFYDRVFPLSDHADFKQLLEYVRVSNPRMVYTVYGFTNELAWHIRKKLGIPARPLEGVQSQSVLQEFG